MTRIKPPRGRLEWRRIYGALQLSTNKSVRHPCPSVKRNFRRATSTQAGDAPDLLRKVLSSAAASTAAPALSSMLIYLLMAIVLVVRPEGLFPAAKR